jgi:hypothetical protein
MQELHGPPAVQAVGFVVIQFAFSFGLLLALDPTCELFAVNPQVLPAVSFVGSTKFQPIS